MDRETGGDASGTSHGYEMRNPASYHAGGEQNANKAAAKDLVGGFGPGFVES